MGKHIDPTREIIEVATFRAATDAGAQVG